MMTYRTDRDRQVQGDRVLERQALFADLGKAVVDFHGRFASVHAGLQDLIRVREEPQDPAAEELRAAAETRLMRLYNWAYHQLAAVLAPDWQSFLSDERVTALRERLFPIGSPSMLRTSSQLVLDAANHLLTMLKRDKIVAYPDSFLQELAVARESFLLAVAAITGQPDLEVTPEHVEQRSKWDDHYLALRDISMAFLRVEGRLAELDAFFGPEPEEVVEIAPSPAEPGEQETTAKA